MSPVFVHVRACVANLGRHRLGVLLKVHDRFADLDVHRVQHVIDIERSFKPVNNHQHCICTATQPFTSHDTAAVNFKWL